MRRRELIRLAGSVGALVGAAGLVGCGLFSGNDAPAAKSSDGAGATPTGLPTPSFPPSTAPIITALRVDNAALMLWFSKASDGTPSMTSVWYDTANGGVVTGPASMTSVQAGPEGPGFRSAIAAADQEGRMIVYGWLVGPVAQVWLDWKGTRLPGTLISWPADPALQAYWLRAGAWVPVADAPASAPPGSSPAPAPQPATLAGGDAKGQPAFTLLLAPGR